MPNLPECQLVRPRDVMPSAGQLGAISQNHLLVARPIVERRRSVVINAFGRVQQFLSSCPRVSGSCDVEQLGRPSQTPLNQQSLDFGRSFQNLLCLLHIQLLKPGPAIVGQQPHHREVLRLSVVLRFSHQYQYFSPFRLPLFTDDCEHVRYISSGGVDHLSLRIIRQRVSRGFEVWHFVHLACQQLETVHRLNLVDERVHGAVGRIVAGGYLAGSRQPFRLALPSRYGTDSRTIQTSVRFLKGINGFLLELAVHKSLRRSFGHRLVLLRFLLVFPVGQALHRILPFLHGPQLDGLSDRANSRVLLAVVAYIGLPCTLSGSVNLLHSPPAIGQPREVHHRAHLHLGFRLTLGLRLSLSR
mmetsp:Transcript_32367/g.86234  ORF Transcript_32367/g.86234 Transcript_32367/m.86234 type:complete len:358 (-) Transcript_32367:81-1154(-)